MKSKIDVLACRSNKKDSSSFLEDGMGVQGSIHSHVDSMCGNGQSEQLLACFLHTLEYISLKSLQKKCFQYWPESLHETITPGDMLSVTFSSSTLFAEYEVRKFKVKSVRMKFKIIISIYRYCSHIL